MSDKEKEEDIFKRKPKLRRSPEKTPWLSLPATSSSSETFTADDKEARRKSVAFNLSVDEDRRKSVSFNLPATSSTLCHQSDSFLENLINFDLNSESLNPNDVSVQQFGYSLDPYIGAQATFSELNENNKTQVLTNSKVQERPFVVHGLVFLVEKFCLANGIDYDGALAESSN